MEPTSPRRAILALVERYPGLHVRELARQAETSEALALYHLDHLVAAELVEAVDDGNFRRFYPVRGALPSDADRSLVAILRRRVPLQIALFLLEKGNANNQALVEELSLAKSTVSYHVSVLEREGFLRRDSKTDSLQLVDAKNTARLLTRWEPPRDAVSRFSELWDRFYARRKPRR